MSFLGDVAELLGLDKETRQKRIEERGKTKRAKAAERTERKSDRQDTRQVRAQTGTSFHDTITAPIDMVGGLGGKALDIVGENPEILGAIGAAVGGPAGAALSGLLGGGGQQTVSAPAPQPQTPSWVVPAAIGAGVLTVGALVYAVSSNSNRK